MIKKKYFFLLVLFISVTLSPFFFNVSSIASNFRTRVSTNVDQTGDEDFLAELKFGREVASRLLGMYKLYNNKPLVRYVNLIGKGLALYSRRPEIEFRIAILDTDAVNAYAIPGGYIFLTKGAILQMENEAELAGVIAHEIAHIVEKHIVKELNIHGSSNSNVAGVSRFIGASTDPAKRTFLSITDMAVDILLSRGLKIQDEEEADRTATMYLAFSQYDPSSLIEYFNKIKNIKNENIKTISKTHPSFDERISLIKAKIIEENLQNNVYKKNIKRFKSFKINKP